jgi:hypothetical protein
MPDVQARPLAIVVALALMGLLLALVAWRTRPPAARGIDAPSDEFSAGRALAVERDLLAEGAPHPVGSETNDLVRQRLIARLQVLGYDPQVQETAVHTAESGALATYVPVKNVLVQLPGQQDGPAVLLVAHYDSVAAGPGAGDNTSNVASLVEIARIVREQGPFRNPIYFLFSDGEEAGLIGARGFAGEHPWMQNVGVVINLESRGSSGQSLLFETSEDNAWLIAAYAASVPQPATNSLMFEVYKYLPNDTDLSIFKQAGKAGLNFSFIGTSQHYHTALDNLDTLDPGSVQHQGDSVLAVALELAAMDLSSPPHGNAVYTDFFGTMLRWPVSWAFPLAVGVVLLLLAVAIRLIRRGWLTTGRLLLGFLATFLSAVLSILLGLGLLWIIGAVAGEQMPWYAYPLPARIGLWAGALLCAGLMATAFRRAGWWGLSLGMWLFCAVLTLILSFTLPGVSILFWVPACCAALLMAIVSFSRLAGRALAREIAVIAPALVGGSIWLALALSFEVATGLEMSPAIQLGVGLTACTLAPLFALPRGENRAGRGVLLSAAAVALIATGVAPFVPTYSAASPQPINLGYFEDTDAGTAYWYPIPLVGDVPASLRPSFSAEPQVVLPWSERKFPVAPAPAAMAPPPGLQVLADEPAGSGRIVTVQLYSARNAREIDLLVPMDAIESLTIAGETLAARPEDSWNGYYNLWCYGQECDGLQVELRLKTAEPVEVLVSDWSDGLPAGGEALLQARTPLGVAAQDGDMTIVARRVRF